MVRRLIAEWRADQRGSVALMAGVVLPVLLVAVASSVQYAALTKEKSQLQNAADAGALGAAKQLNLANPYDQSAAAAAKAIVQANLNTSASGIVIDSSLIDGATGVSVTVTRTVPSSFGNFLGGPYTVAARAKAHATGGPPICAIALDPKVQGAVTLDASAVVDAHTCAVYSNSKNNLSIYADQSAILKTKYACSVGGKKGNYPNFAPQPLSGCPAIADPLASRPAPTVPATCAYMNLVVTASTSLAPGTYCGGLHVTSGAAVNLQPGIYFIEGGPLNVDMGASLLGTNVGFFLTNYAPGPGSPPPAKPSAGPGPKTSGPGSGTTIYFAEASTINLTAPKSGALAGLLFFEDRSLPANQLHQILSDNAQNLVGTVYLPQGRLFIGSNAPVASDSAYTVVVARTLELSAGPTLVLNSNYSLSDVPVPKGVGPQGNTVSLTD